MKLQETVLSEQFLSAAGACEEAIEFCRINKLFGFPLKLLDKVEGDYYGYVKWLSKRVKTSTVDECGRIVLLETLYKTGTRSKYYEYDDTGRISQTYEKEIDKKVKFVYDFNGNISKTVICERSIEHSGYDDSYIVYKYDEKGRISVMATSFGFFTHYFYNEEGQLIMKRYRGPLWVSYEYDSRGYKIKENWADGDYTLYERDERGNITSLRQYKDLGIYRYSPEDKRCVMSFVHSYEYYPNGQLKRVDDMIIPEF